MKFYKIISSDFCSAFELNLKYLNDHTSYGTLEELGFTVNQFFCYRDISLAITDYFESFTPFSNLDCKLAMNLSIYKLMIDSLGSETFNKLVCKSIFKHLIFDISSFQVLNYLNCKIEDEFESFHSVQLYYLRGYKDYLKFHPLGEWQGHWVVCVSHSPVLFIGYQLKCPITLSELTDLFILNTNKGLEIPICTDDNFCLEVEYYYDLTRFFKP